MTSLFLDRDLTDLLKHYPDLALVQVRNFRLRYWTEVDAKANIGYYQI